MRTDLHYRPRYPAQLDPERIETVTRGETTVQQVDLRYVPTTLEEERLEQACEPTLRALDLLHEDVDKLTPSERQFYAQLVETVASFSCLVLPDSDVSCGFKELSDERIRELTNYALFVAVQPAAYLQAVRDEIELQWPAIYNPDGTPPYEPDRLYTMVTTSLIVASEI